MIILYRTTFGGGHQFLVGPDYTFLLSYIVGDCHGDPKASDDGVYLYNWYNAYVPFNALFEQSNQLALLVVTGKTPQQVFELYNDSLVVRKD